MATLYSFILFFFLNLFACSTFTLSQTSTYIVHVSHSHKPAVFSSAHDWYSSILHSISSTTNLMYTYSHSATGFAAQMSATNAAKLRRLPFVLSVVPDKVVELATTHSPDFLGLTDGSSPWPETNYGSDIIIGVVDTGIWPERTSFHDHGIGSVPAKWRGFCESGPGFPASSCNKKIIGARFFYKGYEAQYGQLTIKSARDEAGHGTHCASTAAGSAATNAGYNGYALGEARGVAPMARIAVYKVFWGRQSSISTTVDVLAAMDQAIADGVDVLSLSLSSSVALDYYQDQIAVASFRAVQQGVVVSAAAGNGGPGDFTVNNVSPWMLTVAASSVDRRFSAHVVLGNGRVFVGSTLYDFRQLSDNSTASFMLITGQSAGSRLCVSGELVRSIVAGKIVICEAGQTSAISKSVAVEQARGIGMILVNQGEPLQASPFTIPATTVTPTDGNSIKSYVNSTLIPTAILLFKGTIIGPSPSAPRLATFSSRGPNNITPEILKPDVTAPGLNILAAWAGVGPNNNNYNIISGTSMACPHVSGLAALLRKAHPSWSPSAIKSAIMTTSYNLDNDGNNLIDLYTGRQSSPYVHGSGHIDPRKAVDPGLVYDLDTSDYIAFLCSIGYDTRRIAQFVVQDPSTIINCSANNNNPSGDLNYPSFSVVFESTKDVVRYTRVVKNVGSSKNVVYGVSVNAPPSVKVKVYPRTLKFSANQQTLSYTITLTSVGGFQIPTSGLVSFGSIEWSDGSSSYNVRSPIAVYWPYEGGVQYKKTF